MIILSRHAKEQARERGISINEIRLTIQNGAKYIQHPNKIVSEWSHIRIVYKKMKDNYFVVTVMLR